MLAKHSPFSFVHRDRSLLIFILVAIFALSACGQATPTPTNQTQTQPTSQLATINQDGVLTPRQPRTALTLQGDGASFPAPLYQSWIVTYKKAVPNLTIGYQSTGSGQGIKDFSNGLTDFGATDAFMNDEELKAVPDTLHIPMVLGAVVVIYNLNGIRTLKLSPETLTGVYRGVIKTWNDPAIVADNQGIALPSTPIVVVYRSDGSGTTSIFTSYLSSVNPEWKSAVGSGTTVKWPIGSGAPKNDGVAAFVAKTPGSIGYVEQIYAFAQKPPLPVAALRNAAGAFVLPDEASIAAAADSFSTQMPQDLRISIVNPPGRQDAYPISGFTYILVHKQMADQTKAEALTEFLYWSLTSATPLAQSLKYVPLPETVRKRAIQLLTEISSNGQPVLRIPNTK